MLTLIDEEGPVCRNIFGGEKLIPFAALYRGELHPDGMGIGEADSAADLLCFFYQSNVNKPTVAIWLALEAFDEYSRMEDHWYSGECTGDCDHVRYGCITVFVA